MLHPLHDHEEGHAERVNVEQSAEDYGDLQVAVVHPEHYQEAGQHEEVDTEQDGGQYHNLHAAVVHQNST